MSSLEIYIEQFSRMKRAPGRMWGEATLNRAPHKPILLLSVMDLIDRGLVKAPFFEVTEDLVELNELFNGYWRCVVPAGQTSSIAFPFSRLHHEPFWELVPQPGTEITRAAINGISTVKQLRRVALGATLDKDLFLFLSQADNRCVLREALLQACFSTRGRRRLEEQICTNKEAYSYSQEIVRKAVDPEMSRGDVATYKTAARDQGFRRIVVRTYDHRCALCGVRIITSEGRTVVDAAHIIPFCKTRNDDIRNGMALCKICHWSFDWGMLGLSDDYNVIVSQQISMGNNYPGSIVTLAGRGAILPEDQAFWPASEYLAAHRKEWGL